MFILSHDTIRNRSALELREIPRIFFGRVMVWPRAEGDWRLKLRLIFEIEGLRYFVELAPFALLALVWRDTAIGVAQAPALMVLMVFAVEMRLLRPTDRARARLMEEAERDRLGDLLAVRGRAILTKVAAGRRMAEGSLHLVIEQSELARVAPLTLVSVQWSEGPVILDLTVAERALIRQTLFEAPLTEAAMHRRSLAQAKSLHAVALEVRSIPAHARMAALTEVA